jgi:hypothetical protein
VAGMFSIKCIGLRKLKAYCDLRKLAPRGKGPGIFCLEVTDQS